MLKYSQHLPLPPLHLLPSPLISAYLALLFFIFNIDFVILTEIEYNYI